MKSSAPWSVKGVEKDARETAKEAARREGMTVGEWLNQVIYTASDPASSNGQIEGLKISDLVSAIEHVSKRVIGEETRSTEAFEEIGKNLGGIVDRLQRLERQSGEPGGLPAELEARLARIEERSGGRDRIEALKSLERAVGQVALQFDAAQKSSSQRIQGLEEQVGQFGARLDDIAANSGSSAASVAAIDHLKNTIDGVSARIARLERTAQDIAKAGSLGESDPEFVERTTARLRVLGDEVKRGGDQLRALEAVIKKLSEQIDAAERRSAEGVQKVAETISALRSQILEAEAHKTPDARAQIEVALADTERRTEDRINALQHSLEAVLDRLERATGVRPVSEPAPAPSFAADPVAAGLVAAASATTAAAPRPEAGGVVSAIDLDFSDDDAEAAFDADDFDLGDDPPAAETPRSIGDDILAEVEAAFSGTQPDTKAAAPSAPQSDDIDSLLSDLEGFGENEGGALGAAEPQSEPQSAPTASVAAPKPNSTNYLAEARRAAKEAAEKAAAEASEKRRKLTPKQRAILAAKVKKKRLAAEQATQAAGAAQADIPAPESPPAPAGPAETGGAKSFIAKAAAAIGGVLPLVAKKGVAQDALTSGTEETEPTASLRAKALSAKPKVKPLTVALGAAVVLAVASLAFVVKDMILGGKPKAPTASRELPPATAANPAVAIKDPASLEVPTAPVVKPRALYLDSVAKLKSAGSESETLAAMKGLEEAAALGHPPAQLQLGELYKLGQGAPQDAAKARAWYERAANGGNVLAMHRIGVMSARGQGGPADQAAAIAWFEKAANLGLVDSQYNLGAIFHPGGEGASSGAQDAGKAYFWYSLAAKNGDSQAGALAAGLGAELSSDRRRAIDADVAKWQAQTPDPDANEVAPAS
ncbi:MAG: SEL1-like repeat protein [Parvularculaceae bacterium]|nr:SEL1-like repeat protein [Parvularculaceae bacterium]